MPYLPAPSELNRKFQQDTREEIPQDFLYWGRHMQYLKVYILDGHNKIMNQKDNNGLDNRQADQQRKANFNHGRKMTKVNVNSVLLCGDEMRNEKDAIFIASQAWDAQDVTNIASFKTDKMFLISEASFQMMLICNSNKDILFNDIQNDIFSLSLGAVMQCSK